MAIKVKVVRNPLSEVAGSTAEPYMFEVVHCGSLSATDIQAMVDTSNPQMTEPLADLALEQLLLYGAETVEENYRFNFGSEYFSFEAAIPGSVPTMDAALGEDNEPYINVVNGQSLGAKLAATIPEVVTEDLGDVMFKSIETVFDGEELKDEIVGNEAFALVGKRLSFAADDEKTDLVHPTSGAVVSACTLISVDTLGQRAKFRLAEPPASEGEYKLKCSSHGKDTPDAELKTKLIGIAYKPKPIPPAPTVTKLYSDDLESKVKPNAKILHVEGTNLGSLTKDNVVFKCEDTVVAIPTEATWTFTDTTITMDSPEALDIDGVTGDAFSVTISGEGFEPVIGTTTLA